MDKEYMDNLYNLARVGGSDKEKEKMRWEAASILEYVNSLKEAGVDNVGATKHVQSLLNVFRPDENDVFLFDRKLLLDGFPEERRGYLKVKAVFKNNG